MDGSYRRKEEPCDDSVGSGDLESPTALPRLIFRIGPSIYHIVCYLPSGALIPILFFIIFLQVLQCLIYFSGGFHTHIHTVHAVNGVCIICLPGGPHTYMTPYFTIAAVFTSTTQACFHIILISTL